LPGIRSFTAYQKVIYTSLSSWAFLGAIFLLIAFKTTAQQTQFGYPYKKSFNRSDYKLGLHPVMLAQASNGMIYGANHESMTQFDGRSWIKYEVPYSTNVLSVLTSANGRVYIGCTNDLGYFEPQSQSPRQFKSLLDKLPESKRNFGEVWKVHDTDFGIVFQAVNQMMILNDTSFDVIEAPSFFHFSFYTNGQLYVVDNESGLLQLQDGVLHMLPGTKQLANKEISSVISHGEDLIIATQFQGIYNYGANGLKAWSGDLADRLKTDQVFCAVRLDKERIAFGTVQDGLIISSNTGSLLLHMNELHGLQSNTIQCMLLDQKGDLWLGTNSGIDLLHISRPLTQINQSKGLGTGYSAVVHGNKLYLGTNRGVFFRNWNQDQVGFADTNEEFQLIPNTKGQVWSLKIIDGKVFCGHHDGIFVIENGNAEKISDRNGTWSFHEPVNTEGILLAGTYRGLLLLKKNGSSWQYQADIKGFDKSSRVLLPANDGSIWMGHGYEGIYRLFFNQEFDSVTHFTHYNSGNGFQTDYSLNPSSINNETVFLTPNGVYEFNFQKKEIQQSAKYDDFFPYTEIATATEDEQGNIWYYSQGNLAVKRIQEDGSYNNISLPFNVVKDQFIRGFEFTYPIDAQHVIIASEEGFIHYNPALTKEYKMEYQAYIHSLKLGRSDSLLISSHIFQNASEKSRELPYGDNNLVFSFYAVDFEDPQHLVFSTYLEGYDSEWSTWNSRTEREFTNLREGKYQFMVKARNVYNTESSIASYFFEIAPPFYRASVAYFLYCCLLILSAYFSRKQLLKQQKYRFQKREEELRQETLIAERELIKLRNEQLREKVKLKDQELANSTMQIIQKNKFINELKSKLTSISDVSEEKSTKAQIKKVLELFSKEGKNSKSWKLFEAHFANVHGEFLTRLAESFPHLSPAERRLCACLRMNISSKEIGELLNISMRSVESSRYRLRKSLNLKRDENLTEFIFSI